MMSGELSRPVADTLIWIADQYTVNWHHLVEVYNRHPQVKRPLSTEGMRSLLRKLARQGYIEWKRLIKQTPNFVYVTPKTLRELELPYPEYEPKVTQTLPDGRVEGTTNTHKNQINQVRLYLEQQHGRAIGWVSERRLRLDQEPDGDGNYPHRADALVWLGNRDTAIEVERHKKGLKRQEQIMLDLMSSFDQTYYYCTQPETYGQARRVARDLDPAGEHFCIVDWSEII